MEISFTTNPNRRVTNIKTQPKIAQTERRASVSAAIRARDEIMISPEARKAMQKEGVKADSTISTDEISKEHDIGSTTVFTSFADEFNKITNEYTNTIRAYYAKEHEENLTYDDPSTHIWNKYKNPESPDFRSDLSDDERA